MAENDQKKEWKAEIPEDDSYEEERLRKKWEKQQDLKNAQREKRLREQRRKIRVLMLLTAVAVVLIAVITVLTITVFVPLGRYHHANRLMEEGDYGAAISAYRNILGYKDADARLAEAIRLYAIDLSGREDVIYETTETAPWFKISEQGLLKFDEKKYTGSWDLVVVPDVFNSILVTALDDQAFAHCEQIKEVKISECVLTIGDLAFYNCESLEKIVLPMHLTEIGESAFGKCRAVRSISFGTSLERIGAEAFQSCTSVREIVLPDSLTEIGARAFNVCTELTSVSIGRKISGIGSRAFEECAKLETLYFRGTSAEWDALGIALAEKGLGKVSIVCTDAQ